MTSDQPAQDPQTISTSQSDRVTEESARDAPALTIAFGTKQNTRTVSWPIVRQTEKAKLVLTPGGEVWIPNWRWSDAIGHALTPDEMKLKSIVNLLADLTSSHRDSRILVKRAGKGPTELSVRISYVVKIDNPETLYGEPFKTKSTNVARSLTKTHADGKISVPCWVLEKKLAAGNKYGLGKEVLWSKSLGWPGMEAIESQLWEAVQNTTALRQ